MKWNEFFDQVWGSSRHHIKICHRLFQIREVFHFPLQPVLWILPHLHLSLHHIFEFPNWVWGICTKSRVPESNNFSNLSVSLNFLCTCLHTTLLHYFVFLFVNIIVHIACLQMQLSQCRWECSVGIITTHQITKSELIVYEPTHHEKWTSCTFWNFVVSFVTQQNEIQKNYISL